MWSIRAPSRPQLTMAPVGWFDGSLGRIPKRRSSRPGAMQPGPRETWRPCPGLWRSYRTHESQTCVARSYPCCRRPRPYRRRPSGMEMGMARVAPRYVRVNPAGPAIPCACKPVATKYVPYCIIPSTRGRGQSVALSQVLADVDRIATEGFKEATLTGVHIGSYGRDLTPRATLLELLRALDSHPSSVVFRLSSLEPMDCGEQIVKPGGSQRPLHATSPLATSERQ